MTVIAVVNGELAVDSQVLNKPVTGLGMTMPQHGTKFFKSACGRAYGAKTGPMSDQAGFEATFARYLTALSNWEVALPLTKDKVSFFEIPYSDSWPQNNEEFGFVIMTSLSVLTVSRLGALIHPNNSNTWYACTGADPLVTKTLIRLGFSAREVAEKHRRYSPYSGGEVHVGKAKDLKPLIEKVKSKKPRATK